MPFQKGLMRPWTVIGLDKPEVIDHDGPWKGPEDVEYATLEWVVQRAI